MIFILCVLYSSIRTASNSQAAKLSGAENILLKDNGEGSNADPEANKVWDNEEDEVAYSCKIYLIFLKRILETKSISFFLGSLFHAMFALATVMSTFLRVLTTDISNKCFSF